MARNKPCNNYFEEHLWMAVPWKSHWERQFNVFQTRTVHRALWE